MYNSVLSCRQLDSIYITYYIYYCTLAKTLSTKKSRTCGTYIFILIHGRCLPTSVILLYTRNKKAILIVLIVRFPCNLMCIYRR